MTAHPSGDPAKRVWWILAVSVVVAVLTSGSVSWKWGLVLTYVVMGLVLQLLVRLRRPETERAVHVGLLAGGSSFLVRIFSDDPTGVAGVFHISAVIGIAIGVGYLIADRVRPRVSVVGGGTTR